jgi:Holliday junction resolvasome RuvABC endonuclease subunit
MMKKDVLVGVDPSFNRTGWAVVSLRGRRPVLVACGAISPAGKTRSESLWYIQCQFRRVLEECGASVACFERPGTWQRRGGTRREALEMMAMARGVMLVACAEAGVRAFEVDFYRVRLALLARVNAPAPLLVEFLRDRGFDLPRRPRGGVDLDVANAITMGLYGLLYSGVWT